MKLIIKYNEEMKETQVGGKFHKQHVMAKAKINIPEFFCLTKSFYEIVFSEIKDECHEIISGIDFQSQVSIERASLTIKDMFRAVRLGHKMEDMILEAFDKSFEKSDLVAVRSSMVADAGGISEDSEKDAFAGISETLLYVPRNRLIGSIKECWASGFSLEALVYRKTQGIELTSFGVAIGIQKMIFGERSFVMFTCDPGTSARDTIIACGYGIGEGVVQESVPIDHFFVAGATQKVRSEIAAKDSMLTFDKERGYGLKKISVEKGKETLPALSQEQIGQLVLAGKKIEKIFKMPQDIEGTVTQDGNIYFLQSRPIVFNYDRRIVWTNSNITESFPGVSSALTFSFARFFYQAIFYNIYRQLGVGTDKMLENNHFIENMVGYLDGRIYYNLNSFYRLHSQTPLFPLLRAHWEKMMGFKASYQTHETGHFKRILQKMGEILELQSAVIRGITYYFFHDRMMKHFYKFWNDLYAPLRIKNFAKWDPIEIISIYHRVWNEVRKEWSVTLLNDSYLPIFNGIAEKLFSQDKFRDHPGLLSDLLCGGESLKSVEIMLSAVRLGEMVRSDDSLMKIMKNFSNNEIWQMYAKNLLPPDFSKVIKTHLLENGDRGLAELKMEQPSLRDNPCELIEIIRQYALSTSVTVEDLMNKEKETRNRGELVLKEILLKKSPVRYLGYKYMLSKLRGYIRHRENSRYCRSELFGFSKRIFRELGDQLYQLGAIKERCDVYHLTQEEIFGYFGGTGTVKNLQTLVEIRKGEYEEHLKVQTAEQITTIGPIFRNSLRPRTDNEESENGVLRGIPSSSGKVIGIAKRVINPTKIERISEFEILIAKETDPGWLFLMLSARGIIVEKGSSLSHTAITGRKFNIPTIVALKNATSSIPDGALIEMDGASGEVRILLESKDLPKDMENFTIDSLTGDLVQRVKEGGI
ncbi:MAG: hypothetical protein HQK54_03645 [Oligoflexales bacterium]|nr:hypothetical protein [Oligoflexales bacterium]